MRIAQITVDEAARSAVAILTNKTTGPFQGILGDTLDLTGPAYTHEELAAALTASLGKPVTYVQVPYDAALTSFVSSGWPEWQVCWFVSCVSFLLPVYSLMLVRVPPQAKGVLELYRSVDAGTYLYKTDLPKTIGTKGKTVVEYIEAVKGGLA